MGLLSMGGEERDMLARCVALLAATWSMGTIAGHSVEDVEQRADRFEEYLHEGNGKDRGYRPLG